GGAPDKQTSRRAGQRERAACSVERSVDRGMRGLCGWARSDGGGRLCGGVESAQHRRRPVARDGPEGKLHHARWLWFRNYSGYSDLVDARSEGDREREEKARDSAGRPAGGQSNAQRTDPGRPLPERRVRRGENLSDESPTREPALSLTTDAETPRGHAHGGGGRQFSAVSGLLWARYLPPAPDPVGPEVGNPGTRPSS
ncbi:hypothetical protein AK830_g12676, partial [Neonectria ditissima]